MTKPNPNKRPAPNPQTIFARCEIQTNGCVTWLGQIAYNGYGIISYKGKVSKVHRLIALFLIENPDSKPWVLHSCDNPPCVNPNHLRWGTPKENADDRDSRGRGKTPDTRGSKSVNAVLNESQVLEIKRLLRTDIQQKLIAKMFGVSAVTITNIKQKTSWAHLELSDI